MVYLCESYSDIEIPSALLIGRGVDGDVYDLSNGMVMKLSTFKESNLDLLENSIKRITEVFDFIIKNNPATYAKVYECVIYNHILQINGGVAEYLLQFSTKLEKLNELSLDEKKVFDSILSHQDSGSTKNYSISKIKEMLIGMGTALDFNFKKIMFFCRNLEPGIRHNDIHTRNIMKDNSGNFKLIDFDRCTLTNKEFSH